MKNYRNANKEFDDKVDEWHNGDSILQLHEYLGMSIADYHEYVSPKTKEDLAKQFYLEYRTPNFNQCLSLAEIAFKLFNR